MPNFYFDRDHRGWVGEDLILNLCHLRGIPADLNPAPEEDRKARSLYDILIAGEPFEVKTDWICWKTGKICVEANLSTLKLICYLVCHAPSVTPQSPGSANTAQ